MKVAVVGSGIGGLAAAWLIGNQHEVTLYERHASPGMAAHGVEVGEGASRARVDVPLRVFAEVYYPTLLRLYRAIGVETERVDYSASFSELEGETYFRYRNRRLGPLNVSTLPLRQLVRPRSLRLYGEGIRFYWQGPRDLRRGLVLGETLGAYLDRRGYSRDFAARFLLPAFAGVGTCTYERVRGYPAAVVIDYLTRGGFFWGVRRAVHGADDVVRRLTGRVEHGRFGRGVESVRRGEDGVYVRELGGEEDRFDHVILATQANQARRLLRDASPGEAAALEGFQYERSRVLMHTDPKLMPARRRDWAPVNFMVSEAHPRPMATIWMNAVQPRLRTARPVFQTWSPLREPEPGRLLSSVEFERPVVDQASVRALAQLERLRREPQRRVWFCGAYAQDGVPLLESAVTSGLAVAEALKVSPSL